MGLFSGLSDFFGASDRKNAKKYGQLADDARDQMQVHQQDALGVASDRFDAESGFVNSEQQRFDSIYAPIEQRLADDLNQGPQLEQQAGIAGSDFSREFDASTAARSREQMRQGISYRPGSSAARMQGENDAYNRARGIASARTDARREEDDSHFLKQNAFFQANSNSIQNRVQSGIATAYGADYNALNTAGAQQAEQASYNQGVSNQYSEQSKAGINTIANLAGAYATGGLSLLASGKGGTGKNTGQYLNDGTPNQARAAINGEIGDNYIYKVQ